MNPPHALDNAIDIHLARSNQVSRSLAWKVPFVSKIPNGDLWFKLLNYGYET